MWRAMAPVTTPPPSRSSRNSDDAARATTETSVTTPRSAQETWKPTMTENKTPVIRELTAEDLREAGGGVVKMPGMHKVTNITLKRG
jgi:hypothetical protein